MKRAKEKTSPPPPAEEELFKSLLRSITTPGWLYDPETLIFLDVNRAATEKYGYSRKEFLKMSVRDIYPGKRVPVPRKDAAGSSRGETHRARHKVKGGSIISVQLRSHRLQLAGRDVVLTLTTETPKLKRTFDSAGEDGSPYRRLFEQSPSPMLIYGARDLKILAVNDAFVTKYGYSREEVAGLYLTDLYTETDRRLIPDLVRKLKGPSYDGEVQNVRKDGTRFAIEAHSYSITYHGHAARAMIVEDVCEHRLIEQALRESEERLSRAESVAHMGFLDWDLKTNRIYLSEEACRIHGIERHEELLTPELVARAVYPDDVAFVTKNLEEAISGTKPYDIDHRVIRPDGSIRWVHAQALLSRNSEGEPDRLLGTVVDITERKRAEQGLNESEEHYRRLITMLPDALFVNVDGKIVLANPACCRLLGAADPSELIGMSIFEIVHPAYHDSVHERRRVTLAGGSAPLTEEKYIRLDGTVVEVDVVSAGVEWKGTRGTQVIVRETTERKKAERELRESQERYRSLFENNLVGAFQTAPDGRVLDCNDAFARLFGLGSKADLNGRLAQEFYPSRDHRERYLRLLQEQGQLRNFEYVRKRDDGSLFWTMENVRMVRSPDGQPLRLEGTVIDISERKEAERELQESRERYRRLFEDHTAVKLVIEPETGAILDANEAAARFYGWNREELKEKTIHDINAMPAKQLETELERAVSKEQDHFEFRHYLADGSIRDVEVFTSRIEINGRSILESIVHDITDRKEAERGLRDSEQRYRNLIRVLSDPVYVHVDRRVAFVNDAMCRLLGAKDPSQLLGKQVFEILHPDFHEIVKQRLQTVFSGRPAPLLEQKFIRLDGTLVDVEASAVAVEWEGVVGVQVMARDITERKKAEEQIRHLNRIYNVLSNINQAIVRIHQSQTLFKEICRIAVEDGGFAMAWLGTVNPGTRKVDVTASHGNAEEYLRKIDIDLNDRRRNGGPTGRAVTSGTHIIANRIWDDETMAPWREGAAKMGYRSSAAFPIRVSGRVWGVFNLYSSESEFFSNDEIKLLDELAMDISFSIEFMEEEAERKKAEEALVDSEELLQSSIRVADIGIYEHDQLSGKIFWSLRQRDIYGLDPYEAVTFASFLTRVYPDDRDRVASSIKRAHDPSGDGLWEAEFRIIRPDGSMRWVTGRSQTFFEGKGSKRHPVRTVGATLDTTERRETEERLRVSDEIIRRANSLILIADSRGQITYASPSVKTILGYDQEEVLGNGWWRLTQKINPGQERVIAAAARGDIPVEETAYETRVQAKDGKIHWILWQDAKGAEQELIGVGQDITDRKHAEEALVLSERKYKDIFESAPMGIYQSTLDGRFITCNSEFAKILGYGSPEELIGLDMANDIYYEKGERDALIARYEPLGSAADLEICWKKKDGTSVWIQMNTRAIKDANGNILRFEGFIRDVTERKKAEELLKQNEARRHELELELIQSQKLESLGTLASGVAHDFNNLLGVIIGHATLLDRFLGDREAAYKKNIDAILKASARGAGLVKQMLTFARKTDVVIESVVLNDLVNEIVKFIRETFSKTIAVETHLDPELPAIDADATQVHQVLLNLCVNARDAMPDGGRLVISTSKEDRRGRLSRHPKAAYATYVVLTVSDNGVGMNQETQLRIFEPFFTTKGHAKGTGLGMSLVFGIMEGHNGFITVRSKPGKGSTFSCYFPLTDKDLPVHSEFEGEVGDIPGGDETILAVEDEELLRDLLNEILLPKGYKLILAEDGEKGLALYRERRNEIRLVISDLGLPKFGGDELYRRLKGMDPDVRFILSSGYMEPGTKVSFLREGVKGIMPKPYNPADVLKIVREVLDAK